jgi:hypothetical protein
VIASVSEADSDAEVEADSEAETADVVGDVE